MDTTAEANLLEYLEDRMGESLRGVLAYDDDEYETVFLRSDVEAAHGADYGRRVTDVFRSRNVETQAIERELEFSNETASLQVFNEAIVLHLQGDNKGVVISMEHDVGADFLTFIDSCRDYLPY
ncbi:DUF7522 family protein [Halobaculum sp. EA56]|uniref:DUF7522 family protein n=1 Tax=Halobaculum sp. EA56 TaxID=3421648 RepID=UPI003EC0CBD7